MSWKKFSSNNSRKGVIENNSKQKSSIYASKVFTNDIIVNNETDVGILDISNLNYTRDTYTSDSINILEFMRGTDISVNSIGVENNVDTSGVVNIIKPIKGYVGLFNKLKGNDVSFEKLNVNTINVKNINSINDESKIEIKSDVSFNDVVYFKDISINHFNLKSDNKLIISADISISTQAKSLKIKDASINSLKSRLGNNIIRFDKDISLNKSIIKTYGVSADKLIVSDISVNVIEAKDSSVNITNDISVNENINVNKINLDLIVSDVSIQNDLSINGNLVCNNMKIEGNIGKFNNSYLEFTDTVSFEKTLVKSDISATTITFNTGNNKVPTTEIIPNNSNNIVTYGTNSYSDNSCIVIDGDVSINGNLDARWDLTGMNIIPTLKSNVELINNINDYEIGQLVILRIKDNEKIDEKIFIKSGEKSWHNLVIGNASPFYTQFLLTGGELGHIYINNGPWPVYGNDYTDSQGLEGTEIIFHLEKTRSSSNDIFTLEISYNDPENDQIISFFDNSFSNYLDGAGWGISLENAPGDDISHVKILPPINNVFDFSFTVTIQENRETNVIPIETKVIFKKKNNLPIWKHMILGVSNSEIVIPGGDQSWNDQTITQKDVSYTFNVLYFNPSNYANDTSYYILDLSALDPDEFDVSYRIEAEKDDYDVNDWSWNWVESHKIQIKIPGFGYNDTDFSLEILAHDNSIPDVSNLIPESYYDTEIAKSIHRRIVKFQKINREPEWNYIRLDASNDNLLLRDQSWNTTSNPSIQDSSNQFYLYFDPCKNYVYSSNGIKDLSHYYLDLSALDFEGFDVSYDVSNVKGDLSWEWVDNSRIVIDISDTVELGSDSSLQIISIDDWIDRPNPEERIVKFTHISSEVIKRFDISDRDTITPLPYNTNDNSYQYRLLFASNQSSEIKIVPQTDNDFFDNPNIDYSINTIVKSNNNDSVIQENQAIKIFISPGQDLSFNYLLNNIFIYKFITFYPSLSFSFIINNTTNVTLIRDETQHSNINYYSDDNIAISVINDVTCYFKFQNTDQIIFTNDNRIVKTLTVFHVMSGSAGGTGAQASGAGGSPVTRFIGGGGGGGGSGWIEISEINVNSKLDYIEVDQFSAAALTNQNGVGTATQVSYPSDSKFIYKQVDMITTSLHTVSPNNGDTTGKNGTTKTVDDFPTPGQGGNLSSASSSSNSVRAYFLPGENAQPLVLGFNRSGSSINSSYGERYEGNSLNAPPLNSPNNLIYHDPAGISDTSPGWGDWYYYTNSGPGGGWTLTTYENFGSSDASYNNSGGNGGAGQVISINDAISDYLVTDQNVFNSSDNIPITIGAGGAGGKREKKYRRTRWFESNYQYHDMLTSDSNVRWGGAGSESTNVMIVRVEFL